MSLIRFSRRGDLDWHYDGKRISRQPDPEGIDPDSASDWRKKKKAPNGKLRKVRKEMVPRPNTMHSDPQTTKMSLNNWKGLHSTEEERPRSRRRLDLAVLGVL